jgi:dihydroorotate dehydrogenase electron transfer subunit
MMDIAVEDGRNVALSSLSSTPGQAFPLHLLPAEVEIVATGRNAPATGLPSDSALVHHLRWADQVFACGPDEPLRGLQRTMRREGLRKPAQAVIRADFPCGAGICNGCTVFTRHGPRLACKDGPSFELRDLD